MGPLGSSRVEHSAFRFLSCLAARMSPGKTEVQQQNVSRWDRQQYMRFTLTHESPSAIGSQHVLQLDGVGICTADHLMILKVLSVPKFR